MAKPMTVLMTLQVARTSTERFQTLLTRVKAQEAAAPAHVAMETRRSVGCHCPGNDATLLGLPGLLRFENFLVGILKNNFHFRP